MSGGIIRAAITQHSPRSGIEARAPEFTRGLIQGCKLFGEELRAARPDAVVLMSTHWVTTFPWYTTCQETLEGVCVADEAPDLIPGLPYKWKGDPALARAIVDEIKALGVMAAYNESPDYSLDYGTVVPMHYMDPGSELTLVSLGTCIIASLEECLQVGAAVRRAAEKTGRKIAMVGSTSLTHRLERGPEKWPAKEFVEKDERFIEMLTSGRIREAKQWLPSYVKEVVAEVGGRVIATVLGAMDETRERYVGVQHGPYGQSSASGNVSVSVRPI
jgi:3,4-dihydroxyphenylacetate 2,3-dioxygenase